MQKIIAIIVCWCCFLQASAQSNIVKLEYFVDTDPGFGNGTSVSITPATNISNIVFNVPLGSFTPGLHTLYTRSKDANGKWSITNSKLFYKSGTTSSPVNITRLEYFFDTDPGVGNGTNIPITPGVNLQNINYSADISVLTIGIHYLFVRSKDANGKWSITNKIIFYKAGSTLNGNIVKAEYYFDTNPGFGNGNNIALTAGPNIQNLNFSAGITNLAAGVHFLFVRSKNANGAWSVTNNLIFYKSGSSIVTNIVRLEYFIDTDPGFGNATGVSITPGTNIQNTLVNVSTLNLSEGIHFLSVRSKDASGRWSITNKFVFVKLKRDPANNITNMEYFIDNNDPGFGKAIPLALNPASLINDFVTPVNISGLTVGNHTFSFRSRSNNGWSVTNMTDFPIAATAPAPYINVNAITKTLMCARDSVKISYDAIGVFNSGNIFKVELSDGTGAFPATPLVIGSYTGITSTIVNCILPSHTPDGTNYRVRVSGTNPVVTGATGINAIVIHDRPFAQTITGASDANAGYSYPYSVPFVTGSTWQWTVPAATISQTTNSASLLWNTVGQPQSITIYETNQYGCLGDASTKNVNVYPLKIINTTPTAFNPCPGGSITVAANAFGVYYAGNVFVAQLSNSTGSFATPTIIGTYTPTTQPIGNAQPITINATMPASLVNGTNYRVRITGSNYAVTGDTSSPITIVRPSPSFTVNNTIQCHGGNNFVFTNTSTITSGSIASYLWNFGDNTISTGNSPSHIYLTIGNYAVKLIATSNLGCMDSVTTNVTVNNCGTYTFIGNGDWLTPSNWQNNLVPPTTIPTNMNITINPTVGGQCFYIGTITLQLGGIITVMSGKAFNIRLQ